MATASYPRYVCGAAWLVGCRMVWSPTLACWACWACCVLCTPRPSSSHTVHVSVWRIGPLPLPFVGNTLEVYKHDLFLYKAWQGAQLWLQLPTLFPPNHRTAIVCCADACGDCADSSTCDVQSAAVACNADMLPTPQNGAGVMGVSLNGFGGHNLSSAYAVRSSLHAYRLLPPHALPMQQQHKCMPACKKLP